MFRSREDNHCRNAFSEKRNFMMAAGRRRGGFGQFGFDDEHEHGFGRGRRRRARLLRGDDLKLALLLLLSEEPRHGYDLIKAIEDKSNGAYSPSPGVIYPALSYLDEADHIESRPAADKKVYQTTEAGELYLSQNRAEAEAVLKRLEMLGTQAELAREWQKDRELKRHQKHDRDLPGVIPEVNEARRELKAAIGEAIEGDEDTQRRLAEILKRAANQIRRTDIDI